MNRSLAIAGAVFLFFSSAAAQSADLTRWVDPFIGTAGHGHTFPGATTPFGMVQLSPDTRTDNWDGSSGYHYSDDVIYGFSHTHLSGTGIPDYCDILLMPWIGKPAFYPKGQEKGKVFFPVDEIGKSVGGSHFSHANEKSEPGYYSVLLDKDNILAEMTATSRVGMHRYTFPKGKNGEILIDLGWRDEVLGSSLSVYDAPRQDNGAVDKSKTIHRIEGFRRSRSWAKDQIIYFVVEFSKQFTINILSDGLKLAHERFDSNTDVETYSGKPIRASLSFDTNDGQPLIVKVALSPVSIDGARNNLDAEMPGWDFDKVRSDAKAAWNKELGKIEVSGGSDEQMRTFYSALYHTMIQPNVFDDVDGAYRGHDGKVHNIDSDGVPAPADVRRPGDTGNGPMSGARHPPSQEYTVFSLWDTFRAAHPLYTIIDRRRTVDFINTFIRQYEQGGRLPVWELAGNETDCMIGYHAVSVIADAMAKGIEGFDYNKAYEAAKHSAELDRDGLAAYKNRGYISSEDENESVSKTLEYAYDDWCIAQMAKIMGQRYEDYLAHTNKMLASDVPERQYASDYQHYMQRAHSFENLFDPQTGFMRPKKNGGFVSPFAPNEVTFNYTEGNAWVYTFFVPQDIGGLIALMGGRDKFAAKLDELFTTTDKLAGREQPDITGLIGQYAHGNEPSHHIAYLYNYAGQPWKTQNYVRKIMDEFYKPTPDGLIGNEDCGQMSAWYVLSASGLYQVTPGSPFFDIGTPLFPLVKYHLENGKTFSIIANGVSSSNKYVQSVRLNGAALKAPILPYAELQRGGTLEFDMSDEPVHSAFDAEPPRTMAASAVEDFPPVPIIESSGPVFSGETKITLSSADRDASLFYSLDGSEPKVPYMGPITIDRNTELTARAVDKRGHASLAVRASFHKKPNDWSVSIASQYNRQYTGGGDEGLIDGIRGSLNFASGEWQGYQGQDFIATVDLKHRTRIGEVGGGFLQNARSWIWMPTHVVVEASDDDQAWRPVADIKTDIASDDMDPKIRDLTQKIAPTEARYIRIHAYNLGKIPSWHPGAGGDAFIFVDEIIIR